MPNNPTTDEALERYLAGEITFHEYSDILDTWDGLSEEDQ